MHRKYCGKEGNYMYWEDKILSSHLKNPKRMWDTFNALLDRCRDSIHCRALFRGVDLYSRRFSGVLHHTDPGVLHATENTSAPHHPTTEKVVRTTSIISPGDPNLVPLLTLLCNKSIRDGILPLSQNNKNAIFAFNIPSDKPQNVYK